MRKILRIHQRRSVRCGLFAAICLEQSLLQGFRRSAFLDLSMRRSSPTAEAAEKLWPAGRWRNRMDHLYRSHKSVLLVTSVVLWLAVSLSGQTFDAPGTTLTRATAPKRTEQVFSKKIFWAEAGAYTLFNVLDGYTTVAHPRGYEEAGFPHGSSFLLGKQPSAGRYVATMGIIQAATSFAAYRLEQSQKRVLRIVGHTLMIQGIYAHTDGYIGNVVLVNETSTSPQAKPAP